jgi:hypothetical protein
MLTSSAAKFVEKPKRVTKSASDTTHVTIRMEQGGGPGSCIIVFTMPLCTPVPTPRVPRVHTGATTVHNDGTAEGLSKGT